VIRYLLSVIEHLASLNNYSSVACIANILTSSPVTDLKKTLEIIKKGEFSEMEKFLAFSNNYQSSDKLPCIPPVTVFLDKISKINQNPILHNGRINWNNLRYLSSFLNHIRAASVMNYNISNIQIIKQFIKERIDLTIQKADLDNIVSLAITSDANSHSPAVPTNLKILVSKFDN